MATVEVTSFRLRTGVARETFLSADARAQDGFFYGRPGLLRRTTAAGAEGEWAVIALWRSEADAAASGAAGGEDDVMRAWAALVDISAVRRYATFD